MLINSCGQGPIDGSKTLRGRASETLRKFIATATVSLVLASIPSQGASASEPEYRIAPQSQEATSASASAHDLLTVKLAESTPKQEKLSKAACLPADASFELTLYDEDWTYYPIAEGFNITGELKPSCQDFPHADVSIVLNCDIGNFDLGTHTISSLFENFVIAATAPNVETTCRLVAKAFNPVGEITDVEERIVVFLPDPQSAASVTLDWPYASSVIYPDLFTFNAIATVAAPNSIAKVEFFGESTTNPGVVTKLGEDNSPPQFSLPPRTLEPAHYTLYAVATDSRGYKARSAPVLVTSAPNQAPVVRILSPKAATPVAVGTSITISALATDIDGYVATMRFYSDSKTVINTQTRSGPSSAPFEFVWNGAALGTHQIYAEAEDDRGLIKRLGPLSVTVTNSAPVVSLLQPAHGQFVAHPGPVALSVNASDNQPLASLNYRITPVSLPNNGNCTTLNIAGVAAQGFSASWTPVCPGRYRVGATAVDAQGLTTSSAENDVFITKSKNNVEPFVKVISPAPGGYFKPGSVINFVAQARDDSTTPQYLGVNRLNFVGNGSIVLSVDTPSSIDPATGTSTWSGSYTLPTNAPLGNYAISAAARETGSALSSGHTVPFNVNVVNKIPLVATLSLPNAAKTVILPVSTSLSLTYTDPDAQVTGYTIWIGENMFSSGPAGPATIPWIPTTAGEYKFRALINGANGQLAETLLDVTVLPHPGTFNPIVSILDPINGQSIDRSSSVFHQFKVRAVDPSGGSVNRVEFLYGDAVGGIIYSSVNNIFQANLGLSQEGAYRLGAKAVGPDGNIAYAEPVNVFITSGSPQISIVSPVPNAAGLIAPATVWAAVNASDDNGVVKVRYYDNDEFVGEVLAAPGGAITPFDFVYSRLAAGNHRLRARAFDAGGNFTDSAEVSVTVAINTAPTLTVADPVEGKIYFQTQRVDTSVQAADPDAPLGFVQRVEYQIDGQVPIAATAPQLNTFFSGLAPGNHQLKITAYDDKNAPSPTVTRNFFIQGARRPVVSMLAPSGSHPDGFLFTGDQVTLTASAVDPDAEFGGRIVAMEFYRQLGSAQPVLISRVEGTQASYTATLTLDGTVGLGSQSFYAKAFDDGPVGPNANAPLNAAESDRHSRSIEVNVQPSTVKISRPVRPSTTRFDGSTNPPADPREYPRTTLFAGGNTQLLLTADVVDPNSNPKQVRFYLDKRSSAAAVVSVPLTTVQTSTPGQQTYTATVDLAQLGLLSWASPYALEIRAIAEDTRGLTRETLVSLDSAANGFLQCGGEYAACVNTTVPIAFVPAPVAPAPPPAPLPCGGVATVDCDANLRPQLNVDGTLRIEGERVDTGGQGVGSFATTTRAVNPRRSDSVAMDCSLGLPVSEWSPNCVLTDYDDGETYRYSLTVGSTGTIKPRSRIFFPPPNSLIVKPAVGKTVVRGVQERFELEVAGGYLRPGGRVKYDVFYSQNPSDNVGVRIHNGSYVESLPASPRKFTLDYTFNQTTLQEGDLYVWAKATLEQGTRPLGDPAAPIVKHYLTEERGTKIRLRFSPSGVAAPAVANGDEDVIRFEPSAIPHIDTPLVPEDSHARAANSVVSLSGSESPEAVPCSAGLSYPQWDGTELTDEPNSGPNWFIIDYCDIENVVPNNYWIDFRWTRSGVKLDYWDLTMVQAGGTPAPRIELTAPVRDQEFVSAPGLQLTARAELIGVQQGHTYEAKFFQREIVPTNPQPSRIHVATVTTSSGVAQASWDAPQLSDTRKTYALSVELRDAGGALVASYPAIVLPAPPEHLITIHPPGTNQPPQVTITEPNANGSSIPINQAFNLRATTSDDPSQSIVATSFIIQRDGGSSTTTPATFNAGVMQLAWTPATAGNYSIIAVARDNLNLDGQSTARTITVVPTSTPVPSISAPLNGDSFAPGATVPVVVTVANPPPGTIGLRVTVRDQNAAVIATQNGSGTALPITVQWPSGSTPVGDYTLSAQVETSPGVYGAASQSVLIHLQTGVPSEPSITFQNPLANDWVFLRGETIQLKAALGFPGGSFEQVWAELFVNGQSRAPQGMVFDATSATLNANWTAEASSGTQELRVHARHSGGQVLTATRTFTVAAAESISEQREYIYDDNERLCKVINPESGATLYAYDEAGNIAWTLEGSELTGPDCETDRAAAAKDPDRVVRVYEPDSNRVALINYPAGTPDISYTYEADGALDTVTTSAVGTTPATTWTYDYNNRRMPTVERMSFDGKTFELGYGYNANGHLDRLRYPDTAAPGYSVDYAPDALGRATHVRGLGAQTMYANGIKYYPNGMLKQFTYGNGVQFTLQQNERQLPESSISVRLADNAELLADHYTYDANGNVSTIVDTAENHTTTRGMEYDDLDRLTLAIADGLWGEASYIYDGLDNLRSATQGGRQYRYNYNEKFQLSGMISPAGTNPITLGYNPVGDVTTRNGVEIYNYDAAHRLRAVQGIASYVYDAHGRRVRETKQSNGQVEYGIYSQSGQKLFKQIGNDKTRNIYLGGSLIAITVNGNEGTSNYTLTDALGSVVADVTNAGTVTARYRYAPYGESLGAPLGIPMDGLGYTGHDMDADTGLTYMQQRYYDPVIGRFLSVDPAPANPENGGNFNRYWYANNNPYRFVDLDGRVGVPYPGFKPQKLANPIPPAAMAGFVADFIPIIGDAKGFYEAYEDPSFTNIAGAVIGLVPVAGDVAKKLLKHSDDIADAAKLLKKPSSPCNSFDEDTLVQTDAGPKRIVDLKVGDRVLARNEITGVESYQPIEARFNEWHDSMLVVEVSVGDVDDSIVTTDEHPFFVVGKGFVPARGLIIGDEIRLANDARGAITSLERIAVGQPAFNLTVANDHTYFVGVSQAWVHNAPCALKDGDKLSTGDALDAAADHLGPGYSEIAPGVFKSQDGKRLVRMTDSDLAKKGNHAGDPHMNFESGNSSVKPNGRETFNSDENIHIFLPEEK